MERNGKTLKTLAKGDKRRLSDGRNAWRKMDPAQRSTFLAWLVAEGLDVAPLSGAEGPARPVESVRLDSAVDRAGLDYWTKHEVTHG